MYTLYFWLYSLNSGIIITILECKSVKDRASWTLEMHSGTYICTVERRLLRFLEATMCITTMLGGNLIQGSLECCCWWFSLCAGLQSHTLAVHICHTQYRLFTGLLEDLNTYRWGQDKKKTCTANEQVHSFLPCFSPQCEWIFMRQRVWNSDSACCHNVILEQAVC